MPRATSGSEVASFGELDLPMAKESADLPAPKGHVDLPAPAADLPVRRSDDSGGLHELDLPMPQASAPSLDDSEVSFGDLDLPGLKDYGRWHRRPSRPAAARFELTEAAATGGRHRPANPTSARRRSRGPT